ncbi:MAG: histidine kinase [Alkaliphilus sp.]|nr:sensor histidine kinase [bacterium AH-315-G05]PHS32601.1 MAG: histidine kinase [Alkaliphilus sp.]
MINKTIDINMMDEILNKTIATVEDSKEEIFEIAESMRTECDSLQSQLEEMKKKTKDIMLEVVVLEKEEKQSRQSLLKVSKFINKYCEEDIKEAYRKANLAQVKLTIKQREECDMIKHRNDLEIRLSRAGEVLKKADGLTSKIGVALEYLTGNIQDMHNTLGDFQQKRILGQRILLAQEDERKRVAREIHDGPAQTLSNMLIRLEVSCKLMDIDAVKAKRELEELKTIAKGSMKDIRKIIYNLRPMSLDDVGLIPSINRYITSFQQETKICVELIVLSQVEIDDSLLKLTIFRIIQESLNNIRKHSRATNVKIILEKNNAGLALNIRDDGIGFDVSLLGEQQNEDEGFGILSMRERAELLNGDFTILSNSKIGTKIRVFIPHKI